MKQGNDLLKLTNGLNKILLNAETVFLSIITISLVAAIFVEVICRYFLFYSVAWAEEITRYLFIWLTFIGSAYALFHGQHTEIDVLKQAILKTNYRNKDSIAKTLKLLSIVATTLFLVAFASVFYSYMMQIWARVQTSPTMHIPMGLIYLPVLIGTVISIFHEICMFVEFFIPSNDVEKSSGDIANSDNNG